MLARYRSVPCLELLRPPPPPTGPASASAHAPLGCPGANPVLQWEEAGASAFRADRLAEAPHGGGGLATCLRLWEGPLAGIAHQTGQFPALQQGPEAELAPPPPEALAEALSYDLELLMRLAGCTREVLYDASGSESEFAVLPIILEPRLEAAAAVLAEAEPAAAAEHGGEGEEEPAGSSGGGGGGGGGAGGPWWSVAAALAAPLGASEVAASLGVAPELAALMQPPLEFASREAFWRHMHERHITRLAGGEGPAEGGGEAQGDDENTYGQPGSSASAAAVAGGGLSSAAQSRAALASAVRHLSEAVSYPVVQFMVGSEALGWNPIPLLWLGRSRRSGAILGLLTAVVWT